MVTDVVLHTANYISLCSGIGGLDLAVKLSIPQSRCVCYVEREAFSAAILVARMEDSSLDKAPIWSDIATFDCEPWRGSVDFVVAGFPCQPVSLTGKRKGDKDERWLWEDVIRVVRQVGAKWVFLENVAGILSMGFGNILGDLAESGLNAEWVCVPASGVGSPHKRDRWFCLGYSDISGLEGWERHQDAGQQLSGSPGGSIFPPPPGSPDWERIPTEAQPAICGKANGAPSRVDRLRALGNGVVPSQAAVALRELLNRTNNQHGNNNA